MSNKIGKLADQAFRLVFIVQNLAHHRSLDAFKDDFEQDYWVLISNNFLDIAILEWCKIFGAKGQETHWSKCVNNAEMFRQGILKQLGVSQAEWDTYWERIKNYRDQVVAHHQSAPNMNYDPNCDYALVACFYYYEILIKELRTLKCFDYPDNLEEYFQNSLTTAKHLSDVAVRATKEI